MSWILQIPQQPSLCLSGILTTFLDGLTSYPKWLPPLPSLSSSYLTSPSVLGLAPIDCWTKRERGRSQRSSLSIQAVMGISTRRPRTANRFNRARHHQTGSCQQTKQSICSLRKFSNVSFFGCHLKTPWALFEHCTFPLAAILTIDGAQNMRDDSSMRQFFCSELAKSWLMTAPLEDRTSPIWPH